MVNDVQFLLFTVSFRKIYSFVKNRLSAFHLGDILSEAKNRQSFFLVRLPAHHCWCNGHMLLHTDSYGVVFVDWHQPQVYSVVDLYSGLMLFTFLCHGCSTLQSRIQKLEPGNIFTAMASCGTFSYRFSGEMIRLVVQSGETDIFLWLEPPKTGSYFVSITCATVIDPFQSSTVHSSHQLQECQIQVCNRLGLCSFSACWKVLQLEMKVACIESPLFLTWWMVVHDKSCRSEML